MSIRKCRTTAVLFYKEGLSQVYSSSEEVVSCLIKIKTFTVDVGNKKSNRSK